MATLTEGQRKRARNIVAEAALLGYHNRGDIHYSRGTIRWQGIDGKYESRKGQYPRNADCSAYSTWCLWNGLYVAYNKIDVVNGARWRAGYTGTMMAHGVVVRRVSDMRKADVVLYAYSGQTPTHVATVVGRDKNGVPMVVSHGSEAGPLYLPYNYRRIICVRRYIRKGV